MPAYSVAGDPKGIYNRWNLGLGSYTLTAVAFTENRGNGAAREAYTAHFDVVDNDPALPTVTSFTLTKVGEDNDLGHLLEGAEIDLNSGPGLIVRANTLVGSTSVGSVRFFLNGQRIQNENKPPYEIPVTRISYYALEQGAGQHRLSAIAYSMGSGKGVAGPEYSITITII